MILVLVRGFAFETDVISTTSKHIYGGMRVHAKHRETKLSGAVCEFLF